TAIRNGERTKIGASSVGASRSPCVTPRSYPRRTDSPRDVLDLAEQRLAALHRQPDEPARHRRGTRLREDLMSVDEDADLGLPELDLVRVPVVLLPPALAGRRLVVGDPLGDLRAEVLVKTDAAVEPAERVVRFLAVGARLQREERRAGEVLRELHLRADVEVALDPLLRSRGHRAVLDRAADRAVHDLPRAADVGPSVE